VEARPEPRPKPPARAAPQRPPGWWIGAGAGGLFAGQGQRSTVASLSTGVERPFFRRRLGLQLSTDVQTNAFAIAWPTGHASIRQFPVRMGAYLPILLGIGQLETGIGVDLDVISVAFSDGPASGTEIRASPGADAALGWALFLPHDIYLRAAARAGIQVSYALTTSNDTTIFTTPRFDLHLGIEFGVWFP